MVLDGGVDTCAQHDYATKTFAWSELVRKTYEDIFGQDDEFRPFQRAAYNALKQGHDAIVVAPTGSGKTRVILLWASAESGVVAVLSPLVALTHDHMANMAKTLDNRQVAFLGAGQGAEADRAVLRRLDDHADGLRVLIMSPESIGQEVTERLRVAVKHGRVVGFVVDEAHYVTQCSLQFRPRLIRGVNAIRDKISADLPILCLTGTCAPDMPAVMAEQCRLRNNYVLHRWPTDRPNLRYLIIRGMAEPRAIRHFVEHLRRHHVAECGTRTQQVIVYGGSVKHVQTLKRLLEKALVDADLSGAPLPATQVREYYSDLAADVKADTATAFKHGGVNIICATNAFGLGVNNPNTRVVAHFRPSLSPSGQVQEMGRAGRDGRVGACYVYSNAQDQVFGRRLVQGNEDNEDEAKYMGTEDKERAARAYNAALEIIENPVTCIRKLFADYFGETTPVCNGTCGNCRTADGMGSDGLQYAWKDVTERVRCIVDLVDAVIAVDPDDATEGKVADIYKGRKALWSAHKKYDLLPGHGKGADLRGTDCQRLVRLVGYKAALRYRVLGREPGRDGKQHGYKYLLCPMKDPITGAPVAHRETYGMWLRYEPKPGVSHEKAPKDFVNDVTFFDSCTSSSTAPSIADAGDDDRSSDMTTTAGLRPSVMRQRLQLLSESVLPPRAAHLLTPTLVAALEAADPAGCVDELLRQHASPAGLASLQDEEGTDLIRVLEYVVGLPDQAELNLNDMWDSLDPSETLSVQLPPDAYVENTYDLEPSAFKKRPGALFGI